MYLGQVPPSQVLAAAVGQTEDKVGDRVLAHVGPRAVPAERANLHVLVERLSQRSLVVIAADVSRLSGKRTLWVSNDPNGVSSFA